LRSATESDARGGTLADFVEQLHQRGVRLRVVWGARGSGVFDHLYLTEDSRATRVSLETKPRIVERIRQWRGTVWVGQGLPKEDVEGFLDQTGPYGGRVGDFILFGDERILRWVREACPEQSGR
jgi:hypothetical protein